MTEITYGRIRRDGEIVGYCSYINENGKAVQIYSPPYKPLEVYVAGERVKAQTEHVIIWTKVAGWLGIDDTLSKLRG